MAGGWRGVLAHLLRTLTPVSFVMKVSPSVKGGRVMGTSALFSFPNRYF